MIVVAFGGIPDIGDAGQGRLRCKQGHKPTAKPPPIIDGKLDVGWSLASAIFLAAGFAQWW